MDGGICVMRILAASSTKPRRTSVPIMTMATLSCPSLATCTGLRMNRWMTAHMIPITIKQLKKILRAKTITPAPDDAAKISAVNIDSRTTQPGDCFFAIPGENFDGHDYIAQALQKNAACIVVQKNIEPPNDKTPILKVDDTIKALGDLARWYRTQLPAKVVAITGSVGKTTTRNIVYNCLKNHFNTLTDII